MIPFVQQNFGRLHILFAKNDSIQDGIDRGFRAKRSLRFDRLNGQFFFTVRVGTRFIDIDWI